MKTLPINSYNNNNKNENNNDHHMIIGSMSSVGSIEDIDIDSEPPPITINLQKPNYSNNSCITVVLEKENCQDIKSVIDNLKDQLESTVKDLNFFKENLDILESNGQIKEWLNFVNNIKGNSLNNSNVYLTIPTTVSATSSLNNSNNNLNIMSPDSLKSNELNKISTNNINNQRPSSPINNNNNNNQKSLVTPSQNKNKKINEQQNNEEEDINSEVDNIQITNYTQGPSMLTQMKKKFENKLKNSNSYLISNNNNNKDKEENLSKSLSPPIISPPSSPPQSSTIISSSLATTNPLSLSKRMNKIKTWTSTKPSSSSIGGFGSSNVKQSSLNITGSSRFFTSRQDSSKLILNQPQPQQTQQSNIENLNTNKNNEEINNEEIINNSDDTILNPEEEELKKQILKERQENDLLKKKQYFSKGYFVKTCNADNDDCMDEEEISINDEHWETNVIVLLPCRHHVKVPGSSSSTIESIRQLAWASGKMQGHINLDKDEKFFTLKWCNKDCAFDQDTPLLHLIQYNLNYNTQRVCNIKLELVLEDELCKERLVDLQSLEINNGKPSYWKSHIDEVLNFNLKLREIAIMANPQFNSIISARSSPYPPPASIPEFFVIRVHIQNQTKSLRCSNNHTAFSLMTILSEKLKNTTPFNPSEYLFLITGLNQYINPNLNLLSIEYILEKIKRKGEIDLTIININKLTISQLNQLKQQSQQQQQKQQQQQHQLLIQQQESKLINLLLNNNLNNNNNFNDENQYIKSISIKENLKVRILHAHEIFSSKISEIIGSESTNIQLLIEVSIYFGGELLATQNSRLVNYQDTVVWNEWIEVPIQVSNIPNGSRMCLGLNAKYRGEIYSVGWVGHRLFDSKGILNTFAPFSLLLWPGKINPIGSCVDNLESKDQAIIIAFEFKEYFIPKIIYYDNNLINIIKKEEEEEKLKLEKENQDEINLDKNSDNQDTNGNNSNVLPSSPQLSTISTSPSLISLSSLTLNQQQPPPPPNITNEEMDKVEQIILQDPLYSLSKEEKLLLWKYRYFCQTKPNALAKLLQSVEWTNYKQVGEIFQLLENWPILPAVDALELLDPKFADCIEIREYAVKCLDQMSDYELEIYMLQLVQSIKHDIFHGSILSLFLIGRVLQNIDTLGHLFFWYLRADIDNQEVCERFRVLTSAFLRYAPNLLSEELKKEITTLRILENLSKRVREVPYEKRKQYVENHLFEEQNFPKDILIPYDASIKVLNIVPEKCKSMDSAKVPLWVTFKNSDSFAPPLQMIVKTGDDLRQDILTLQLLRLMDHMWKSQDLDLHMTIYRCIATGLGTGLIEVVPNSETAARIQAAAGGFSGAFKQTPIANWLKNHNQTENNYQKAVSKFTHSCAGYCVATYVLGIGDRHNDNIMIDKYGHLFHIDFGHFLGNFKTFAGFQREKAPFVLTPDFVYVIGGKDSKNFNYFIDICCKAFNIIRTNAHIFINMFELMLSTGIPELKSESDIVYLRDKFRLDLNDQEAAEYFKKLIHESIGTLTTQINFAFHIFYHRQNLVNGNQEKVSNISSSLAYSSKDNSSSSLNLLKSKEKDKENNSSSNSNSNNTSRENSKVDKISNESNNIKKSSSNIFSIKNIEYEKEEDTIKSSKD